MGIDIVTPGETHACERVADLPGDWDGLPGADDCYLTRSWLTVVESTAGVPMRYLLARRAGRPVAGLATALLDTSAPWLLGRPDTLLAQCTEAAMPGAAAVLAGLPSPDVLMPSLVCGGRHLGRTGFVRTAEATDADLADLLDDAERRARSHAARSVAFLYVDERDESLRGLLERRGYRWHESARYCRLSLPGGGFDGYLDTLSAHRRRRVLAERRRIAAAGVDVRIEPFASSMVDRMADLETMLFAKYGMREWQAARSAEFLARVREVSGDRAVVSVARAAGEIRGFGLLLRHGDQWFAHRAGFDYEFQRRLPLYYETLYYRPAEVAADHGVRAIHYGIGSTEAKVLRGCASVAQYSYLLRVAG